MGFASLIIKFHPISNRIPEYHHFEEQLYIGQRNSRQNSWRQWPGSTRRSGKRSVFLGGSGFFVSFHFLQTDLFLEAGIMDDSVQC